jgi:hypothetical protein
MCEITSIDDGRQARTSTVVLSVNGPVQRRDQVDATEIFERLWRDAPSIVWCARFRLSVSPGPAGPVAAADGILILEDGRVVCAASVAGSMSEAVQDVSRRLRARSAQAAVVHALDRTA